MKLYPKLSLDDFIALSTPLASIPALEAEMESRVEGIAEALLSYESTHDQVVNLANFLRADENFLGIILALTNLSQEKLLRILSAERFADGDYGQEWGIKQVFRKLQHEQGFAERLARLFIEGRNNPLLAEHVAAFYLKQLSLPRDWPGIIQDENLIQSVIRHKLRGEYNDKKGDTIEQIIRSVLDEITQKHGVNHTKGQVRMVGGKEVDHVLPSLDDPYVMIMSSYMETTSSSQTARANEQREMYLKIQGENQRYGTERVLVNFVDGGGWLARRSDLKKLHASCDYIINLKTLDRLKGIICYHMPDAHITDRPSIEKV